MSAEYLTAWALVCVLACFVITVVSIAAAVRAEAPKAGRVVRPGSAARPPRYAVERSSAASVVHVHDAAAYDAFLRELIVTTHVEEALR